MYTILSSSGDIIYSPVMALENRLIIDPTLKMAVNKASVLEFTCPDLNAKKAVLQTAQPEIHVYHDSVRIFRGRIITLKSDWNRSRIVHAESDLAYLQDGIIRPFKATKTPAQWFAYYITQYNSKVDAYKQFAVGVCNITGDSYEIDNNDYDDALSLINELIEKHGGFITTRTDVVDDDEINYIDWVSELPDATQTIEYAKNLLDITETEDISPSYTVLIPLGASTNGTPLTLGTPDYIEAPSAYISRYGRIEKSIMYPDAKTVSDLRSAAQKDINAEVNSGKVAVDVKAVDLGILGDDVPFEVAHLHRVISPYHGYTGQKLRLMQATIKLFALDKSTYVFGGEKTKLSVTASRTAKANRTATKTANTAAATAASAASSAAALSAAIEALKAKDVHVHFELATATLTATTTADFDEILNKAEANANIVADVYADNNIVYHASLAAHSAVLSPQFLVFAVTVDIPVSRNMLTYQITWRSDNTIDVEVL